MPVLPLVRACATAKRRGAEPAGDEEPGLLRSGRTRTRGPRILKITPEQLAILTREHMIGKVHAFLLAHSPDAALQALLASPIACRDFWLPHYEAIEGAFGTIDEHALAARLSYLLAARAHGMGPRLAYLAGEDGVIAMKSRLEERGVLAWGAWDN